MTTIQRPKTFRTWLMQQQKRNDPIGDLANDAAHDESFPRYVKTLKAYTTYLEESGACDGAMEALSDAWEEWRASEHPNEPEPVDSALRAKTRRLIREWTKEQEDKHQHRWLGVAPSYLCAELDVDYDEACAILLDLQAKGFIYDNGNGNHHRLEDGRTCATRFYMAHWKEKR